MGALKFLSKGIIFLLLTFCLTNVFAQQKNITEKDIIKKARLLFNQEKWEEALPLFAQLVSVYPDIVEYNYKFGICTLYGDASDRRRPIRYLNNAFPEMVDSSEIYYHLGLAYYQNREYANAIQNFELYQDKTKSESSRSAWLSSLMEACRNGISLEHKNLIKEIISKEEFSEQNFPKAYPEDDINGTLIQRPDMISGKVDDNNKYIRFIYVSEDRGKIYFSALDSVTSQRDLYQITYDDNGNWSSPIKIPGDVNTLQDEDYPVISNKGATLYFSSKGHNSIGGYDIYKSKFDTASASFSEPENMGNGLNSPFDDILFIPDKTGNYAYFSTKRDAMHDGINVYKVKLMDEEELKARMLAESTGSVENQQPSNQDIIVEMPAEKEIDRVSTITEVSNGSPAKLYGTGIINNNSTSQQNGVVAVDISGKNDQTTQNSNQKKSILKSAQPIIYPDFLVAEFVDDETLEINVEPDQKTTRKMEKSYTSRPLIVYTQVKPVYIRQELNGISITDDPIQTELKTPVEDDHVTIKINGQPNIQPVPEITMTPLIIKDFNQNSIAFITSAETDKSHSNLLEIARTDPDELSYEELLLAAELTPLSGEKLKIYRAAFIHIDRDWRAYYKASQTARELVKSGEASVYLYQATLITAEGEIQMKIEGYSLGYPYNGPMLFVQKNGQTIN